MIGLRLIQNDSDTVDLEVSSGHLAVGDVTEQNQYLLLTTHRGEWKEHPLVGVGISDIVNDHDLEGWKREIAAALEDDGQTIEQLELTTDKLNIKASYRQ